MRASPNSRNAALADEFVAAVLSPAGQAILAKHGFISSGRLRKSPGMGSVRNRLVMRSSTRPATSEVSPPRRDTGLLLLLSLPLVLFFLAPLLALIRRTNLAGLLSNLFEPAVAQAISLSMSTTAVTVAVTAVLGMPLAYLLARRQFRGRTALDTLVDLPMVLPPSVAGIALLLAFGRRGLLGQFLSGAGIELPSPRRPWSWRRSSWPRPSS